MPSTNKTPFAGLPLFVEKDIPSWMMDWNSAMTLIDEKLSQPGGITEEEADARYLRLSASAAQTIESPLTVVDKTNPEGFDGQSRFQLFSSFERGGPVLMTSCQYAGMTNWLRMPLVLPDNVRIPDSINDDAAATVKQVKEVESDVTELKQTTTGLNANVTSLETQVTGLSGNVTQLTTRISTAESEIDALQQSGVTVENLQVKVKLYSDSQIHTYTIQFTKIGYTSIASLANFIIPNGRMDGASGTWRWFARIRGNPYSLPSQELSIGASVTMRNISTFWAGSSPYLMVAFFDGTYTYILQNSSNRLSFPTVVNIAGSENQTATVESLPSF